MIIATPPPNSGLPTLVAQQLPNGTVVVREIPVSRVPQPPSTPAIHYNTTCPRASSLPL